MVVLVVVTAISIAGLALAVTWIRQHRMAGRDAERLELAAIAMALRTHAAEEGSIPHPTNLAQTLAARLSLPENRIRTNRQARPRVVIEDPDLALGPSGIGRLPFVQGVTGSRTPTNARLVILSSMGRPLPAGLTSGAALTTAQFSNLWNAADGRKPADWVWDGDADDLCLQRVALSDLFVTVTLRYREDAPQHRGRYLASAAPTTNGHTILAFTPATNTYLRGTLLSLFGTNGTLQFRDVLQENGRVYTCQDGVWRLGEGSSGSRIGPVVRHPSPEEFADALAAFMDPDVALWPNNTGTTKADLFSAITNFLAVGAYNNQGSAMDAAQQALIDGWVDFTGAQPNKP